MTPAPPLWAIGQYEGPGGKITWEISHDEIQRDLGAAPAALGALGVGAGGRVLHCSLLSEAGQFFPLVIGTMLLGAQVSQADATSGDAQRIAMFLRLLDYDAVLGVNAAILDGLDALGASYGDTFARAGRRCAPRRARAAQGGGRRGPRVRAVRPRGRDRVRAGRAGRRRRCRRVGAGHHRRDRHRHQPPSSRDDVRPHADRGAGHGRRWGRRARPIRERSPMTTPTTTLTRPLISADNHVFEPVDLWQRRLPATFRDRGPRVAVENGWYVMAMDGMPSRKLHRLEPGAAPDPARFAASAAGGSDTDQRLLDMASDGVIAEVIYPTFGLFIDLIPDVELQMACAQIYNDWCAEVFLHRPDVFIPSAIVPVRDVESARAELERVAALGYKSATIPTTPPAGVPYNSADYDTLWQVAVDAGIPLSLHTGTGALPQSERGPGGAIINYAKVGLLSAETLCYFAASGVLERFPELHVVFVETGAGWLPYCCERMDEAFEEHQNWVKPKLANPPSHYAKTQCHVTLGADRAPLLARAVTGVGPLLWASDYPHPEGTFPESQAVVARIFADLPESEREQVACTNAATLYRVDLSKAAR